MRKILMPLVLLVFAGCYYDKEDELYPKPPVNTCDTTNVTYTVNIKPIFDQTCATATCHDAITKSFTHDLSNYNGAKTAANSGRLIGAIRHEALFQPMPKGLPQLSDCDISKITAWINSGTPQ